MRSHAISVGVWESQKRPHSVLWALFLSVLLLLSVVVGLVSTTVAVTTSGPIVKARTLVVAWLRWLVLWLLVALVVGTLRSVVVLGSWGLEVALVVALPHMWRRLVGGLCILVGCVDS